MLQNRSVIVTGADSGIGQAAAEAFAKAGADVAISYQTDADGAAETRRRVEAAGRRAHVAQADVGDPASVEALFEGAARALGTPHLLFANAGTGMGGCPWPIWTTPRWSRCCGPT
jgi:glucose 1-dehydrogenase